MEADSRPIPGPWLHGPGWDLLLGAGALYLPIFAVLALNGPALQQLLPISLMPLLLLVTQTPHLGATLMRVYDQAENRRRYKLFAVWATALIAGLFFVGLADGTIGSILVTLYFTVVPWHFTGQNYGITLVFLRRRGIEITPEAKRYLYASFLIPCLMFILATHAASGVTYNSVPTSETVYRFLSLELPVPGVVLLAVTLAYAWTVIEAVLRLSSQASLRALAPALLLMVVQALWYVAPLMALLLPRLGSLAPFRMENAGYTSMWMLTIHSLQYLWISTFYARRERPEMSERAFLGKCLLAGASVYGLPVLLLAPSALGRFGSVPFESGLSLLIVSVLSLHHILLDGAIWKLRDGRIARILIQGQTAGAAEALRRRSPLRSLVWASGTLGVLIIAGGTLGMEFGVRDGLEADDLQRVERTANVLRWLGRDSSEAHASVGFLRARRRDHQGAIEEFERSLALRPTVETWLNLGSVHEHDGEVRQALNAYESALALAPTDPVALQRAGRVQLSAGDYERARRHLEAAIAQAPATERVEIQRLLQLARDRAVARPEPD